MDQLANGEPGVPASGEKVLKEFSFTGNAKEYFGIWIVNLLLSIVTLGIYTAWAKVRRLRYFYGNTWLDGHNFEYHARPVQILIGRIIVVGILLVINLLINFVSPLFGILIIPYLFAFPWLINKSLAFNARMTTYRNVRLNFGGTYWGAFLIFVVMPIVASLTLGLLAPVVSRMSSNYIGNHLGYGAARFATDVPVGKLYGNLGGTIAFVLILGVILGGVAAAAGVGYFELSGIADISLDPPREMFKIMFAAGVVGLYIAVFLGVVFYMTGVRNHAFRHSTLDDAHGFSSTLGRGRYVWILVSNLFVTLLTLSLMRPWAAVRSWRYLASNTSVLAAGSLDNFIDRAAPEGNVVTAEFFDIEGIDFGL
ncbi:MAG: YjgN family protein [Rhizobiaceae bacterium]